MMHRTGGRPDQRAASIQAGAVQQSVDIRPLTALRFFAAMWVVLFHFWPNLSADMPAAVAKGYLGVELFFTLSGFILCHVYLDSVATGRFGYGGFLWARLARVYPLHLATLVGVGVMAIAAESLGKPVDANVLSWAALPANLTLTQAWGLSPVAGWNHPSWSISAEWFAYLSFPAFAFAALKLQSRPWLALAAALALLWGLDAGFERLAGFSLTHATIQWGALRIVPCFALGCAVNQLWRSGAVKRRAIALAGAIFSGAAIAGSVLAGAPDALFVSLFGMLILCLARLTQPGKTSRVGDVFVYLGEISYSIYMICVPWKLLFVNAASRIGGFDKAHLPLTVWLLFVISVVPLAALSYHLIEKPSRQAMRGWRLGSLIGRPSVA
jgi:peptidoglycan/LPS O-acetylase OafA/YrhL